MLQAKGGGRSLAGMIALLRNDSLVVLVLEALTRAPSSRCSSCRWRDQLLIDFQPPAAGDVDLMAAICCCVRDWSQR